MFFQGPLFAVGFGLAVVLFVGSLSAFFRHSLSFRGCVFWLLMSVALGAMSLFPGITDRLAIGLGLQVRGLLVITMALFVAYILIYSMHVRQERVNRELRLISQEVSLLRYQYEYNKREK